MSRVSLHVLKFGGSALATPARVRRAAHRLRVLSRTGRPLVAVVSAPGRTTDRILTRLGDVPAGRETDRALGTGEDLSAALLAAALCQLGIAARSLRAAEAGLEAAGPYGAGELRALRRETLAGLMGHGVLPVVSGFQGVRADGETITLGRGGSDITAVYLAVTLGAAECHLVKDVAGVFDRDPRAWPSAYPFPALTYEELIRLAEAGARVVHPAATRLARTARLPLRIYHFRAPVGDPGGTFVSDVAAKTEARQ